MREIGAGPLGRGFRGADARHGAISDACIVQDSEAVDVCKSRQKTGATVHDPIMEEQLAREVARERRERAEHSSPEDLRAMDTTDTPEIMHMPKELANSSEKDVEYLRQYYEVKPDPALGHPIKGAPQPNPEQKPIIKEGEALHGYQGG